ncbi:MAG: hypothetical protein U9O96_03540 [Candidatus Thermoplasmatota archaeon]|nr:hypothetical protein [Candidatus Thermoplasmatota archaeon]
MAYIRAKKRGNKTYYYLVEGRREDGKVKQKVLRYLGKKPQIVKVELDKNQTKALAEEVFLADIKTSDELKTSLDQLGIPFPDRDIVEINLSHKIGGKKFILLLHGKTSEEV